LTHAQTIYIAMGNTNFAPGFWKFLPANRPILMAALNRGRVKKHNLRKLLTSKGVWGEWKQMKEEKISKA